MQKINNIAKSICRRDNICRFLLSCVLSIMTTAGLLYNIAEQERTFVSFFKETTNAFLILLIGFFALYFILIKGVFGWIDKSREKTDFNAGSDDRIRAPLKTWIIISCIFFICWIPYLIILFPGSMGGKDYFWQLLQGSGALPLSNHHPVLGSVVFALLYKAGYFLGGAEGGMLFTSLFQMTLMCLILGYVFAILRLLQVPKKVLAVCMGVLCLCPIFPLNVIWAVKDSIFSSIAVLFFFGVYINVVGRKKGIRIPIIFSLPALTVLAVLFSLYRNGTTIIAVIMLAFTVAAGIKYSGSNKRKVIIRGCAAIVAFVSVIYGWGILMDQLNVYPTNFREACVTMSRQLLRSYDERPEKFDNQQKQMIKKVYTDAVKNYGTLEVLASRRNYINGDKFKPDYFKNRDEVKDYVVLWFRIGCKNPEIYLDEALHSTYMYWWCGIKPENVVSSTPLPRYRTFFVEEGHGDALIGDYYPQISKSLGENNEILSMTMSDYLLDFPELREVIYLDNAYPKAITKAGSFTALIKKIPIISLFMIPGLYTWITMIGIAYLFARKLEGRIMWPILLLTAIACLSPVNGYMRYVLPVDVFSLILAGICFIPAKATVQSEPGELQDKTDDRQDP